MKETKKYEFTKEQICTMINRKYNKSFEPDQMRFSQHGATVTEIVESGQ